MSHDSDQPEGDAASPQVIAGLEVLRREIDRVDRAILEQLNRRAEFVKRVGELKAQRRATVYSRGRERDLIEALASENPGPFPSGALAAVFREIISGTRSLERVLRVGYLGPNGTFSHQAAVETFGKEIELAPLGSFREVLQAVASGAVDHALFPIENSSEGVVTQALDELVESGVSIVGEMLLPISLSLLSRSGRLEDVARVASHPQPLAQSRNWLDRNLPAAERVALASTAAAAQLANEHADVAAVGSRLCGEAEGLITVAAGIEDRHDNTTRFLILGGEEPPPTDRDLTSVVFTVRKDQAGALHRLLEPFSRNGVNLTSIQSRPLKGAPWEYLFFMDIEGHRQEENVARALTEASSVANSTRILGSFPRAGSAGEDTRG